MKKQIVFFTLVFVALYGSPATAGEAPSSNTELQLTAGRLWEGSSAEIARMRKVVAAHRRLQAQAEKTGLVVAIDAIRKDVEAAHELLALAGSLLQELRVSLALEQPGAAETVIDDPLSYPQFREIRILSDQAEQLFRSDRAFLQRLQRPTETRIERLVDVEPEATDEEPAAGADEPGNGEGGVAATGSGDSESN